MTDAHRDLLVSLLEDSYVAIATAIACEDGLDGAEGMAVMARIENYLGLKHCRALLNNHRDQQHNPEGDTP